MDAIVSGNTNKLFNLYSCKIAETLTKPFRRIVASKYYCLMWVLQIPHIFRHVPSQSHLCYTSNVSSRFPVFFVSLNGSAKSNNNHLIQSLCKGGDLKQALDLLCCEPNPTQQTFEHLIYSCAQHNSLSDGLDVHRHLVNSGFDQDPFLATKLINMYFELGFLDYARKVFDETRERTAPSLLPPFSPSIFSTFSLLLSLPSA